MSRRPIQRLVLVGVILFFSWKCESTRAELIVSYDSASPAELGVVTFSSSLTPIGSNILLPSSLGTTRGLAFDASGNMYVGRVGDNNEFGQIYKYDSSGTLLASSSLYGGFGLRDFAVGTDGLLRASFESTSPAAELAVATFNSSLTPVGSNILLPSFLGTTRGLAFDASGNMYVGRVGDNNEFGQIYKYDSSGTLLASSSLYSPFGMFDFAVKPTAVPEPSSLVLMLVSTLVFYPALRYRRFQNALVCNDIMN